MAHEISYDFIKSKIDTELDNNYDSPNSKAPNNDTTLYEMKNKLPTLKSQYSKVGSPKLMHEQKDLSANYDQAVTYSYSDDNYKTSYIHFYGKSFSSYRNLAYTMLHEFGHALHYFNGSYLNKTKTASSENDIISWKENYAFDYALKVGGIKYINGAIVK